MAKLKKIADFLGVEVHGDPDCAITGFAAIGEAAKGDITFLDRARYSGLLKTTAASAVILTPSSAIPEGMNAIVHRNPSAAFARVTEEFFPEEPAFEAGTSPNAEISPKARILDDVSVGSFAVISEGASVGKKTVIAPLVFVGRDVSIGAGCVIYPNVTIREGCVIGNNVIIHSGTVIGSDGFGYVSESGRHVKIPQRGIVVIEDDVEIGANVTIDRARIGKTLIGRGSKIDNLVMIAHNVKVGANSIIVAQSGISGSTELGENVTVAAQAGFTGHITVGARSMIGARTGVIKDLPEGSVVSGFPAMDHRKHLKIEALYRKLPEVFQRLEKIEARLKKK